MMYDRLQFADFYSRLADDELARVALSNHLVPEAQEALTVELQKRGLTDLSEYKRALEEAAAASSLGNDLGSKAGKNRASEAWLFAFAAWLLAALMPLQLGFAALPDLTARELIAGALVIGLSCYLGLKARRDGSRKGFVLKFVLPLILLGVSTLVVLSSKLLGL
jgi:hypothetical protein